MTEQARQVLGAWKKCPGCPACLDEGEKVQTHTTCHRGGIVYAFGPEVRNTDSLEVVQSAILDKRWSIKLTRIVVPNAYSVFIETVPYSYPAKSPPKSGDTLEAAFYAALEAALTAEGWQMGETI